MTRFLSSATWHLGRRLCTFGCTQVTERARNLAPWCSGKMSRSENGRSPGNRQHSRRGQASQEAASSTAAKLASSDDKRPDTQKIVFWPAQRTRWRATRSLRTVVRSLQTVPCCCSIAIPNAPWQCRQRTRSSTSIPCGIGSPRRQPQKRCSSGAPSNMNIGWN